MKAIVALVFLLTVLSLSAEQISRKQDKEGTVEFSNIATKKSPGKTTLIYSYPEPNNILVFTDQKPINIADYKILKFDCYACNPDSKIDWHNVRLNLTSFSQSIDYETKSNNIDPSLVRAIIHAESAFNPQATSQVGAQGLMQLMPATAKDLGVSNSLNAKQNIAGGTKYIAQLLQQFDGDIRLATAAYNAGPNAVKKYNGIPPYKETQVYVERVAILHSRYQKAL